LFFAFAVSGLCAFAASRDAPISVGPPSVAPPGDVHAERATDALRAEIAELRKKVEKPPKDIWDKVTAISGLASGLAVALIGFYATNVYYNRRQRLSEIRRKAKSRLHMNAIALRTILVAVSMAYGVCFSARAEDAAAAYQSRYSLTGTLVRAAAVCAHDKKSVKSFLEAGVAAINNPELKKLTKAFPSTTEKWMKDGATTQNAAL